jgi:hypothetical protein
LTVLFRKPLLNSFLHHFGTLRRESWFQWQQFDIIWLTRYGTKSSIANWSLTGYRRFRNRHESRYQEASWTCYVRSSTRAGNISWR